MIGKSLIRKVVTAAAVAGCVLVAVVALGFAIYAALALVLIPAGAAALTALLFASAAGLGAWLMGRDSSGGDVHDDEPVGMGQRAFELFRQRPVLGTVAALAGGWIFLRNPALATMVAAAFTEKSHVRR